MLRHPGPPPVNLAGSPLRGETGSVLVRRARYAHRQGPLCGREGVHLVPARGQRGRAQAVGHRGRTSRIHMRIRDGLGQMADWLNPVVAGWMSYYGRF